MKKLILFLIPIILISCNDPFGPGDLSSLCGTEIRYHISNNCDDSPKIAVSAVEFQASPVISNIEDILSEAESGECVLVNLRGGGFWEKGSAENLGNVYLVNDPDKSWLLKDCR